MVSALFLSYEDELQAPFLSEGTIKTFAEGRGGGKDVPIADQKIEARKLFPGEQSDIVSLAQMLMNINHHFCQIRAVPPWLHIPCTIPGTAAAHKPKTRG